MNLQHAYEVTKKSKHKVEDITKSDLTDMGRNLVLVTVFYAKMATHVQLETKYCNI